MTHKTLPCPVPNAVLHPAHWTSTASLCRKHDYHSPFSQMMQLQGEKLHNSPDSNWETEFKPRSCYQETAKTHVTSRHFKVSHQELSPRTSVWITIVYMYQKHKDTDLFSWQNVSTFTRFSRWITQALRAPCWGSGIASVHPLGCHQLLTATV